MGILDTKLFAVALAIVTIFGMLGGGCQNKVSEGIKRGGEMNDASGIALLWCDDDDGASHPIMTP